MSSAPKITFHAIPAGPAGTLKTTRHIAGLIQDGARDFQVRRTAVEILMQRSVKPKDYLGEIKALFEWVQQNLRYTRDTVRVEVLHSARRLLQLRAGDCDDFSILLGAMLEAIGHPVRLVLTGFDPRRPDLFSHIYVEALCKGRWIPLDATMPHGLGWAPRALVRRVISMDRRADMMSDDRELRGLGAAAAAPEKLRDLIRAVRGEAVPKKDVRVKALWDRLRERQLLRRDPWLQALLRRIWEQGLPLRPRPITTARMVDVLRRWDFLPGPARPALTLKPVGSMRPAHPQPARRALAKGRR
jgi:hypothetical protein